MLFLRGGEGINGSRIGGMPGRMLAVQVGGLLLLLGAAKPLYEFANLLAEVKSGINLGRNVRIRIVVAVDQFVAHFVTFRCS